LTLPESPIRVQEMQPKLQPALLRLSAMISQYLHKPKLRATLAISKSSELTFFIEHFRIAQCAESDEKRSPLITNVPLIIVRPSEKDMSFWGYYIPPKAWLGKQPRKDGVSGTHLTDDNYDLAQLSDVVYEDKLPSGLHVRAYCDGLILFDFTGAKGFSPEPPPEALDSFEKTALLRLQRTEVLNAHVVCLRDSLSRLQNWSLPFQSVTPHDLLSPAADDDPHQAVGFKSDRDADLHMARYALTYVPWYPKTSDRRIQGRMLTIERGTIVDSFAQLERLLSYEPKTPLRLTSLFNFAIVSLQDHDYPRSLITSWAIIERLLDEKWNSYIASQRKRNIDGKETVFINADRVKKLGGRDYTASVRTEVLSIVDSLSFGAYQKVENARRVRNGWMHELRDVQMSDASEAIQVAAELFNSVFRFQLPTSVSLSL
jgi:hypothetical protein